MARIGVYADWEGLSSPLQLGILHANRNSSRELFEFEFDRSIINNKQFNNLFLDPRLGIFQGRQFPPQGQETFGIFADASPDRWGRILMRRRLERDQRAGLVSKNHRLFESDYLLGVHDMYRSGALRFRAENTGDFVDNKHHIAAPPFVKLRELEAASLALERDENNSAKAGNEWLRMLIAPGGSLGGARPKASVVDPNGHLWIAKFPSIRDEYDIGVWEMVANVLARNCGLRVPSSLVRQFGNKHHTFMVKRFDRTTSGKRLHFSSAMTLTGHKDGEDASSGVSYLEIARVLMDYGIDVQEDLVELWSRMVFNVLIANTDDHLRNHGFILVPGKGWQLSDAFDLNPVPQSNGLKLNISEVDNSLDLNLLLSVVPFFRIKLKKAKEIIIGFQSIIRQWPSVATALGVKRREQDFMSSAFKLSE